MWWLITVLDVYEQLAWSGSAKPNVLLGHSKQDLFGREIQAIVCGSDKVSRTAEITWL